MLYSGDMHREYCVTYTGIVPGDGSMTGAPGASSLAARILGVDTDFCNGSRACSSRDSASLLASSLLKSFCHQIQYLISNVQCQARILKCWGKKKNTSSQASCLRIYPAPQPICDNPISPWKSGNIVKGREALKKLTENNKNQPTSDEMKIFRRDSSERQTNGEAA